MIICYICEHPISMDCQHQNNLKTNDQKIDHEALGCLCTCHVKSTVLFN